MNRNLSALGMSVFRAAHYVPANHVQTEYDQAGAGGTDMSSDKIGGAVSYI